MTLEEEIAAVREAIASGATEVRIRQNGVEKMVKYETFDKLRDRLEWLLSQQRAVSAPRRNVVFAEFKR